MSTGPCIRRTLFSPGLILRPLDQLLMNPRAFSFEKLLNGSLGSFMFPFVLESLEGLEVSFAGILERRYREPGQLILERKGLA